MSAWNQACTSATPSTVVIPRGPYMVGPLKFQGPCKAPMAIQLQGILLAPTDLNKLKSQYGWVIFQYIKFDTFFGGGTFDKCNSLPIVYVHLFYCINFTLLFPFLFLIK